MYRSTTALERIEDDNVSHNSSVKSAPKDVKQSNVSNSFKVYAKIENNYHLSNKYALFYNMRKYYMVIDRDPFSVLPLTFHVRNGTADPEFRKFETYYLGLEA